MRLAEFGSVFDRPETETKHGHETFRNSRLSVHPIASPQIARRRSMRLLTFTELQRQKGIPYCRDHLRRLVKAGQFPRPIELGTRRIAWAEEEIDAHLEQLLAKRNAAPAPH